MSLADRRFSGHGLKGCRPLRVVIDEEDRFCGTRRGEMRHRTRCQRRSGMVLLTGVILVMAGTEMAQAATKPPVVQMVTYRNTPTGRAYLCRPSGDGPFPVVIYHHLSLIHI